MFDNSDEYITNFNVANNKDVAHIKKKFNVKEFIISILSIMLVLALTIKHIL